MPDVVVAAVIEKLLWQDSITALLLPPPVTMDRLGRLPAAASEKNWVLSTRLLFWSVYRHSARDGQIDHTYPPDRPAAGPPPGDAWP